MSKLLSLLMVLSLIGLVHVDQASAKTKPKSKATLEMEAFLRKLGASFKKPAPRKPVRRTPKKRAVAAPFPMPMPLSIAAQRAGMTVEQYTALHPESVVAAPVAVEEVAPVVTSEVAAEAAIVAPIEAAVEAAPAPEKVEEPQNPYLGKDCKANETDPLMCMTCIIYFEGKFKSDAQALTIAHDVKETIYNTGSDACSELYMEKPNRFQDGWIHAFPWIAKDSKEDTTMTRNEALNKAYVSAAEILGLVPVEPAIDPVLPEAGALAGK